MTDKGIKALSEVTEDENSYVSYTNIQNNNRKKITLNLSHQERMLSKKKNWLPAYHFNR